MRRFNYDENDEYREDVDKFFSNEDGEMSPDDFDTADQGLQQIQINLVSRDLNYRTLRMAIRMLEKSFWWKFKSLETQLKMIDKIYVKLRKLEDE